MDETANMSRLVKDQFSCRTVAYGHLTEKRCFSTYSVGVVLCPGLQTRLIDWLDGWLVR